jgi:hypothetical protein
MRVGVQTLTPKLPNPLASGQQATTFWATETARCGFLWTRVLGRIPKMGQWGWKTEGIVPRAG